jgi:predicted N-acetyltransferase YhbS
LSISIDLLRENDIPEIMRLVEQAGWNQLPADWLRVIQLEPNGCFVARREGLIAGTVTTTCHGNDLAWIGMMLVDQRLRRQGIGRRLMECAIGELQSRCIRSIQLDATPLGKPLYELLGFRTEFAFHRWQKIGSPDTVPATGSPMLHPSNMPLSERNRGLDRVTFGADRTKLLLRLLESSHSITTPDGSLGMIRGGRIADYLGPVSSTEQSHAPILHGLLSQTNRDVFWDIPSQNTQAVSFAVCNQFSPVRTLFRMTIGDSPNPHWASMYALADPALG